MMGSGILETGEMSCRGMPSAEGKEVRSTSCLRAISFRLRCKADTSMCPVIWIAAGQL